MIKRRSITTITKFSRSTEQWLQHQESVVQVIVIKQLENMGPKN